MNLITGTLAVLSGFFVLGLALLTYYFSHASLMERLINSVPIGFGIFGGVWIFVSIVMFHMWGDGLNDVATLVTLILCFGGLTAFFLGALLKRLFVPEDWRRIVIGYLLVMSFGALFFFRRHVVFTGDSYMWLNWSQNVDVLLEQGYPLVNLAVTNLSAMIGVDYYFYVLHPMMALCLMLLMGHTLCWARSVQKDTGVMPINLAVAGILLIAFFINPMFLKQAFYSNHHVLTAFNILLLLLAMLGKRFMDLSTGGLVALLSVLITISRMEGFLFVILAASHFVFLMPDRAQRAKLVGLIIVFNLPYLGYLIASLWDGGFVSGKQYVVMLAGACVLYITTRFDVLRRYVSDRNIGPALTIVLFVGLILAVALKPVYMGTNLLVFIRNFLDISEWGGATILPAIVIPWIWYYRVSEGQYYYRHDALFYYFASALTMVLLLAYFREPLRHGFTDSANRMVFNILPIAYIWVGMELNRLARHNNNHDPDNLLGTESMDKYQPS